MTRAFFPNTASEAVDIAAAIEQAEWLAEESGFADIEELWRRNPDLFFELAAEWRAQHPLD